MYVDQSGDDAKEELLNVRDGLLKALEKLNIQEDPNVTVTNTQLLEVLSSIDNLRNCKIKFERVMDTEEVK